MSALDPDFLAVGVLHRDVPLARTIFTYEDGAEREDAAARRQATHTFCHFDLDANGNVLAIYECCSRFFPLERKAAFMNPTGWALDLR